MVTCGTYKMTYRNLEKEEEAIESTDEESTTENIVANHVNAFMTSEPEAKKRTFQELLEAAKKPTLPPRQTHRLINIHPSPSTMGSGYNSQTTTFSESITSNRDILSAKGKDNQGILNEEEEEEEQQQAVQPAGKLQKPPVGGISSDKILANSKANLAKAGNHLGRTKNL